MTPVICPLFFKALAFGMKTRLVLGLIVLFVGSNLLAEPTARNAPPASSKDRETLVFITGSLIPQRVPRRSVGTATFSPVRIIDRHEIDGTGRLTTAGAFINEPAVSIAGH